MMITITPADVLFFRDSKPFSRGSEHFTRSLFPPLPQTLYGALRTRAMEGLGCDYEAFAQGSLICGNTAHLEKSGGIETQKKELGTVETPGEFTLKGPFLVKDGSVFLKLPADVKKIEDRSIILNPFSWNKCGIESDNDSIAAYAHGKDPEPLLEAAGYISLATMTEYLKGKAPQEIIPLSAVYTHEMRTGIGITSELNATEEGLLYTIGFIRLCEGWSLGASVEHLSSLPSSGLIKFGGANRACAYEESNHDLFAYQKSSIDKIQKMIAEKKHFKLILATPSEFNNGWISDRFNDNLELQLDRVKIKLITAVVGRYENVSGWDMARKKAKPLRRLVPAGSVYYFELLEGEVADLFTQLNGINFTDNNAHLGYGFTLIGGWHNV